MLRKDQAAQLLREGLPPSQIARQMGTSTSAILQYLALKIGEGDVRRSDVAFSLPPDVRAAIESVIDKNPKAGANRIAREVQAQGLAADRNDIAIYLQYRRARVVMGDMYELLRSVELRLHTFVKQAFVLEFSEEQWWRSGVPDNIRAECAALLEKDPEPASEPYCYTHVISLREILDKRWAVLSKYMPGHLLNKKKELLERLLRLNRIRNGVMHPVRNTVLTEEEFEFVRDLERDLADLQAHLREEQGVAVPEGVPGPEEVQSPNPELVTKLAPAVEDKPAPEEAATAEQAAVETP